MVVNYISYCESLKYSSSHIDCCNKINIGHHQFAMPLQVVSGVFWSIMGKKKKNKRSHKKDFAITYHSI